MARMLDLIRTAGVSQHQMMSAARGALRLPAEEMIEILVYIAEHNKIFGEQARLTLAGWDEASAKTMVANPNTPKEILDYWISPKNIRASLFVLLLENPSVQLTKLGEMAATSKGELIDLMIASPRLRNSKPLLNDLNGNHNLTGVQAARVQALIHGTDYVEPVRVDEPAPPEAVVAKVICVPTTLGLDTSLVRLVIDGSAVVCVEVGAATEVDTTHGNWASASAASAVAPALRAQTAIT